MSPSTPSSDASVRSEIGVPDGAAGAAAAHDVPAADRQPTPWSYVFQVVAIGLLYWLLQDTWTESNRQPWLETYTGAENQTADRIESVNPLPVMSRFGIGMLGIFWLWKPPTPRLTYRGTLLLAMAVLALYWGASMLWSINPSLTFKKLVVLGLTGTAAVGVARQRTLHELMILLSAISATFIVVGFVAEILQGNFQPARSEYRFIGTSHPNTLGGYAAICCLAAPVYSRYRRGISSWSVAIFVLGIITLWLTRSRTSLLGVVIALTTIRFVTLPPQRRTFLVSMAALGLSIVGLVVTVSTPKTWAALFDAAAMGRSKHVGSLTGRVPLWDELTHFVADRPLLGHGYLGFWDANRVEYLSDLFGWEIPHGHNMYLDVTVDGGIVGLMLFLGVLLLGLQRSVSRYRRTRDLGVAFVTGLIVFAAVHGGGESLFKLPTFLMFSLCASLMRLALTDGIPQPLAASAAPRTASNPAPETRLPR